MKIAPTNFSLLISDSNTRINDPHWIEWFQSFYDYYQNVLRWTDPYSPSFGKTTPTSTTTGLVAYADGVHWNPGGLGLGYYRYTGSAWTKLP